MYPIPSHVETLQLQGIVTMFFHVYCWVQKKSRINSKLRIFSQFELLLS